MNFKNLSLVIIVSVLTGIGIFYFTAKPTTKTLSNTTPREIPSTTESVATPTPLPSQTPIDKNTNLEAEISQQDSPDFSENYKQLKEEVNQNF